MMLLDESTKALDSSTERSICVLAGELRKHISIVMVAHRPAACTLADRAIVLGGGRVSAIGEYADLIEQHDELIERNPLYERLVGDAESSESNN